MKRVFGIETEYGITLSGVEVVDLAAESMALVRCYTEPGAWIKGNYDLRDLPPGARGFRAESLLQGSEESA
jgi:Pup amidohydrolase